MSDIRRRLRLAALAAMLVVGAAAAAIALASSGSAAHHTGFTGVPPGETTATVTRRTLSESATVDGTLGYASKLEVFDRLSGTFTWLPTVGARIERGETLYRIDDTPVVLMYGSLPAYRKLQEGVSDGPDVAELNENLIELGYDPDGAIGEREAFGEATAAAVKRWQKAEGLAQTGIVELGRVVFAPSARRITEVHVGLGQDPPEGEPAAPAAKEPKKEPAHGHKKGKPADKAEKHPHSKPAHSDPSRKEGAEEPSAKGGEAPSGGGELALTTTSTQQVVQLALKAEQQQLARIGERVPVSLPGGQTAGGRITSVGTVATQPKPSGDESGAGGNESATIPVTVTLEHTIARLDEAPVSVELIESVRREVLTVPATALIATAGGGYAVEALGGGRAYVLAVTPGMFAGGYVQVEGAGLHAGLRVIVSQ